ncbi:MAG TPA: methyl-accepting chemotaxis protein [Burkholderiales bacterium]|nr:methyl-accepting chemotaxis protein [Burkholderiales bacterium]
MKIWQKVLVAPGVAVIFLGGLGAASYGVLTHQHSTLADLFNNRFANYQLATNAAQEIGEVHSNVYRLFTWLGNLKEDRIQQITKEQKSKIDSASKAIAEFAARPGLEPGERTIAEALVKKLDKYKNEVDMAIDLSTVDVNTGMSAMQTADGSFQIVIKELKELVRIEKEQAQQSYESAESAFSKVAIALLAIVVVALCISTGVALLTSRMIVRRLRLAIATAQGIAGGDLTGEVVAKGRDETAELLQALKEMNDSLRKIVSEVRDGTGTISTAAKEIASGNADLSQRTEQQASSLEEAASSMEELASVVKQNAENVKQANQLAAAASGVAVKGGEVVGEVVQTMSSINQASKQIADIIGVIDGIAFQTNILALNAAVEAARAGEQGRGFAVVATEVRTLAQRSAAAAKEIKGLISDSVHKVGEGTRLVDQAGKTMDEIVSSVKRVSNIMAEIAAATQEQSSGIEQVNQAVTQIDHMTQQNAALVEEAAAAAESMREQAYSLGETVSVFKLAQSEQVAEAVAVPAPVEPKTEPERIDRRESNRATNVSRLIASRA